MFSAVLLVSCTGTLPVKTRSIFAGDCLHTIICKAFRARHGSKLLSYLVLLFVDCRSSQSLERQYRSYSINFSTLKIRTREWTHFLVLVRRPSVDTMLSNSEWLSRQKIVASTWGWHKGKKGYISAHWSTLIGYVGRNCVIDPTVAT